MEDRVNELEMRVAELQRFCDELSTVVYEQARAIDQLQASLSHVNKRLESEPGLVDANAKERPPHY